MALTKARLYQIKVTLRGSQPPIWRRLTLSSETTLAELHRIIQAAMGWQDYHLHLFQTETGTLYGPPEEEEAELLPMEDERSVTLGKVLRKPKKRLSYEYDFGDGWLHDILLEKSLPLIGGDPQPICLKAMRACPPEDVGGLGGYAHLLDVLQDPSHPEHEETLEWLGDEPFDPDAVDLDEINSRLQFRNEPYQDDSTFGQLLDEIRETLANEGIESEQEVHELMQDVMARQASRPVADFHGLDPERMHALLYQTFETSWLIWADSIEADSSPVMGLLRPLLNNLRTGDVKTTAKGNLPLTVVREMIEGLADSNSEAIVEPLQRERIRSEEDVLPVHVTHIVAQLAGIADRRGMRLALTRRWSKTLARPEWGPVFPAMFKAMMTEFNWAYLDRVMDDARGIQTTGPFMLWLLHRYGDQWRPTRFYEDAHLQAFPMLIEEIEPKSYSTPEKDVRWLLRWRTLRLFHWFGLIEQQPLPTDPANPYEEPFEIRATSLLGQLVQWR